MRQHAMRETIGVTALKDIAVLYQGDVYDLACLLLKIDDAKDQVTNRRSRYTVYGLAGVYATIARLERDSITEIFKRHGLPLGAVVEYDQDIE